jgi:8-oxo-dGTP diphosphatase
MNKITLAGCAIIKDNKILVQHRKKRDWYELPGGKIDENESPEQTAVRELYEELGCDIEIIKQLGIKDFTEDNFTMTYNWFLAKIKEGQQPQVKEPDKISHLKYIALNELSKHKLSPNMQNFLQEMEKKNISFK